MHKHLQGLALTQLDSSTGAEEKLRQGRDQ